MAGKLVYELCDLTEEEIGVLTVLGVLLVLPANVSILGKQLVVDLVGLSKDVCLDGERWRGALIASSDALGLEIISGYVHSFSYPKEPGITAYVLLDSSHFSVHTYSERGQAALDLFACTEKDLTRALEIVQDVMDITAANISAMRKLLRFKAKKADFV